MPWPAAVTITTRLSVLMPPVLPLSCSPGVSALIEPALGFVFAAGEAALSHLLDLEADSNPLLKAVGHATPPLHALVRGVEALRHHSHGRDIGRTVIGSEDDLILVHRRVRKHHIVDRLGPDVDTFDLFHVVQAADRSDLDTGKGTAAGAIAVFVPYGPVARPATDQGCIGVIEAGDDDFASLAILDLTACGGVCDPQRHHGISIVHHRTPFGGPPI